MLICERFNDFARCAHNNRIIRNGFALSNQGMGTNETILTNIGAIQYGRPYSDQTPIPDRASMNHGQMPDRDILANG